MAANDPLNSLGVEELRRLVTLLLEPPIRRIDDSITMARQALGMDIGYLTEFTGDEQVYRAVSGDGTSFDVAVGEGRPLDESYCSRMLARRIPNLVASTMSNDETRDLTMTRLGRVGAYVGVPVRLADGSLYGTLCAVSHEPKPGLDESRVQLLEAVARVVASGIEQERTQRETGRLRSQLTDMNDELDAAEEDRRLSRILLSGEFTTLEGA
jgi:GAF domain-containing protein